MSCCLVSIKKNDLCDVVQRSRYRAQNDNTAQPTNELAVSPTSNNQLAATVSHSPRAELHVSFQRNNSLIKMYNREYMNVSDLIVDLNERNQIRVNVKRQIMTVMIHFTIVKTFGTLKVNASLTFTITVCVCVCADML